MPSFPIIIVIKEPEDGAVRDAIWAKVSDSVVLEQDGRTESFWI
jgi:hypothetical protein